MRPYADSNFFTRTYLELPESPKADELLANAKKQNPPPLPVTWLHRVETLNAFQLHVFRGREGGQPFVSPEQAALAHASFLGDMQDGEILRPVSLDTAELESQFEEVCLRHSARHGFRTYDILHVISALMLRCDTFWSFDPKAIKLAALEGLKTAP